MIGASGLVGCSYMPGSSKLDDATLANYRHSNTNAVSSDPFGSLARSSGEILHLRLNTLFPASSASIVAADFLPATSTGLNRALAQAERPTSSLAQIALRSKTLAYCRADLSSNAAGSLFSETGIYLRGEPVPLQPEKRLALAAARNAWLYPYREDSPEVAELTNLYSTLRTSGGEGEARRGLCIAVTSAPQFAIGNPKKGDAVRRLFLEVAREIPNFQDIADFEAGKTTLGALVGRIQTDSKLKEGYHSSVRSWHREWLGLRPFLVNGPNAEPRAYNGAASGSYSLVTGAEIQNVADLAGKKVIGITNDRGYQAQVCNLTNAGGQPNVQPFDPRTTMIAWEFRNPVANRFEVFGGFVHTDRLADYVGLVRTYAGAAEATAVQGECRLMSVLNPQRAVAGYPDYYLCPGRVGRVGGGFVRTDLEEFEANNITGSTTTPGAITFVEPRLREQSVLSAVVRGSRFDKRDLRVRRFSPSGEQNGVSVVKLWYSGEEVYMCNSLERFLATCSYRPPTYTEGPTGWAWIADYGWGAANGWLKYGSNVRVDSLPNPRILNQMRCGVPDVNEISRTDAPPVEMKAFPHGFELASYLDAAAPAQTGLNPVAMNVNNDGAGVIEMQAIGRLRESLNEEPYRLVEHILENNLPYSDLLTAKYTVGTPELELYYRAHGHYLPTYPKGAAPAPVSSEPRVIALDQIPGISQNFRTDPRTAATTAKPALLPAKPAAGVLTMPAFLTPVGSQMRTIASRYFTRLLCGEANVFKPTSAQASLHERYMVHSQNQVASATAKAHLDKQQVCYGCHVNLDPLAQALGPNFLRNVQQNERAALIGEMQIAQVSPQSNGGMVGSIWGSTRGRGALLGREVEGVMEVGKTIAESREFAQCVVRRTFENLAGRPMSAADEPEFARWVGDFKANGMNYNRLIRTIADSPIYSGEN